jgi:hypothetical protein
MIRTLERNKGPNLSIDFPGETFRVLKEKEEKQYGEYRTRRLGSGGVG